MKQICSRSGQGFVMLLLRSLAQMLVGLIMCWACKFSLVWVALGGLALWLCNFLLLGGFALLMEWLSQPPRQAASRWELSLRDLLIYRF